MARNSALAVVILTLSAGCVAPASPLESSADELGDSPFIPHVIVGVPDTGISPYHEVFYRPELTDHPCTYIRDFPCDVKELRLTLGGGDWDAAMAADRAIWESVERETWHWIPQTSFIAVRCDAMTWNDGGNPIPRADVCILDDMRYTHGTWTTSSVAMENPHALLAFHEGSFSGTSRPFRDGGIPVDIVSESLGPVVPRPVRPIPPTMQDACSRVEFWPIHVHSAGNQAWPIPLDCVKGDPRGIIVGGGSTSPRSHNALSGNMADLESYMCRPTAAYGDTSRIWPPGTPDCGTSLAAPTVAGALSKVILEVRRSSGYEGGLVEGGLVDPILGLTIAQLRGAMNLTASYNPEAKYATSINSVAYANTAVPLNPAAPWLQWGWGFYDGQIAEATLAHLLGTRPAPAKPAGAVAHMEALYDLRKELYG